LRGGDFPPKQTFGQGGRLLRGKTCREPAECTAPRSDIRARAEQLRFFGVVARGFSSPGWKVMEVFGDFIAQITCIFSTHGEQFMNTSDNSHNFPLDYWKQLKFEFTPTDHMFISQADADGQWTKGEIRHLQDLAISPAAAALNYGQAAFEGMKALRTPEGKVVLFRPEENARRFRKSATKLVMPPYPVDSFIQAIEDVVNANRRWIPDYLHEDDYKYKQPSLYVRPVMIGSGPVLGVSAAPNYTFYIFVSPVGPYLPGEGKVVVLDSTHRTPLYGTGDVKAAGNYAGTLFSQKFAKSLGYKDVLYLDAQRYRYVEELSSSNFFAILKDSTLVTPPLSGSILPGITRDSVITIAREIFGWKVTERAIDIQELLESTQEIFFTGTAAVVQPITEISYQGKSCTIGTGKKGEKTNELHQCLIEIQTQQRADPFGWVRAINV
jgi:branched-chain amino acid aminotransferase